jgi:hypothetical protein
MRKAIVMFAITLMATVSIRAFSQSKPPVSTVVITYVGKSDRPVFPIVVSSSAEEAEWYKSKLFTDPVASFAHVYVVRRTVWTQIKAIRMLRGDVKQSSSDDLQRTSPTLEVIVASGHDSKTLTIQAEDAITFLSDVKACVPSYPSLVHYLSEMEARMHQ